LANPKQTTLKELTQVPAKARVRREEAYVISQVYPKDDQTQTAKYSKGATSRNKGRQRQVSPRQHRSSQETQPRKKTIKGPNQARLTEDWGGSNGLAEKEATGQQQQDGPSAEGKRSEEMPRYDRPKYGLGYSARNGQSQDTEVRPRASEAVSAEKEATGRQQQHWDCPSTRMKMPRPKSPELAVRPRQREKCTRWAGRTGPKKGREGIPRYGQAQKQPAQAAGNGQIQRINGRLLLLLLGSL
jgi:hypothetical protein